MKKPRILVVGSLVMDLITTTDKLPNEGETIFGTDFATATGGKGANQAVQAAKLGAEVTMIGRVGDDIYGEELIKSVKSAGVNVQNVLKTCNSSSAIGNVVLHESLDGKVNNRIIVVPGANMSIKSDDVTFLEKEIAGYDMVILQLEIPMEINLKVARYAASKNIPVMLNSAPYQDIPKELLKNIKYISPNETETQSLTGLNLRSDDNHVEKEQVEKALTLLHKMGVDNVIITLGDGGAIVSNGNTSCFRECAKIPKVEDPTAAGDSFVGAFCAGICAELSQEETLIFANATAGITVSRKGAQPSLPRLCEVLSLMKENKCDESLIHKISLNLGGVKSE